MASLDQDFVMWEEESKVVVFDIVDEEGEPKPVDLSSTVVWVLQKSVNDTTGKISKSTSNGISLSLNSDGGLRISVFLDPADTHDKTGVFYHEARVVDDVQNETVVAIGKATIKASATK